MNLTRNSVSLIGNIGQIMELKYIPETGTPAIVFTLATNDSYKGKDGKWVTDTEWHRIKAYGKAAEFINEKCRPGDMMHIAGKISSDRIGEGDKMHRIYEIIAIEWPLLLVSRKAIPAGSNDSNMNSSGTSEYNNNVPE